MKIYTRYSQMFSIIFGRWDNLIPRLYFFNYILKKKKWICMKIHSLVMTHEEIQRGNSKSEGKDEFAVRISCSYPSSRLNCLRLALSYMFPNLAHSLLTREILNLMEVRRTLFHLGSWVLLSAVGARDLPTTMNVVMSTTGCKFCCLFFLWGWELTNLYDVHLSLHYKIIISAELSISRIFSFWENFKIRTIACYTTRRFRT